MAQVELDAGSGDAKTPTVPLGRRLKSLGPLAARHTLELAEHWIGRVLAMKNGHLQARRLLAVKPLKMS